MALLFLKSTAYTVYCAECQKSDYICTDDDAYRPDDTPGRFFRRMGWRECEGRTLCPKCAAQWKNKKRNKYYAQIDSIHAPREGYDTATPSKASSSRSNFNPRTPRGVRLFRAMRRWRVLLFQSTHLARGVTPPRRHVQRRKNDFNPRTPRGVRREVSAGVHAGDRFQSTHPARGATRKRHGKLRRLYKISIHAPREGCDELWVFKDLCKRIFQSTHPARGATVYVCQDRPTAVYFNPRTPRGVRLIRLFKIPTPETNFNPRTPRGVRLGESNDNYSTTNISIHAPREGCDLIRLLKIPTPETNFNPRTPRGVRL